MGKETQFLIRKGAYYYRPNSRGYTQNTDEAGRYSLDDAIRLTHPNGPDGPRDELSYEPEPARPRDQIEELRAEIERLREALGNIREEVERPSGRFNHLKRIVALNCKALEQKP